MGMTKGTRMMAIQRMTQQGQTQNRSEYGGGSGRRMIGYDRDMNGQANSYGYGGMESHPYYGMENRQRGGNGRYMAGDGWDNPHAGEDRRYEMNGYPTESRRRRDSRGRYMMGGMGMDEEDEPRSYQRRAHGGNSFGDIYADVYAPGAQNRPGSMQGGHKHHEDMSQPVDEHTARKWVQKMDGGEKFKPEMVEQLRNAHCPHCEKWEFYTAINMMYSDYCEAAKKLGVDRADFYALMAKAFLEDADAGEHKLRKYMETIPE